MQAHCSPGSAGRLFFLILLAAAGLPGVAQKMTAVENYAVNRPGVVMIKTVFSADVYVNKMKMDTRNFNHLLDSIQKTDTGGVIYTAEEKLDIVLKEINNNPARFFKSTLDYIRQPEEITGTGTGFFITGDGYVATNCHLIDRETSYIRRQFILSAFQQITDANIAALESSWATRFTEQQRTLLYNTFASEYSKLFSMVLYDLKKDVYVVYSSDTDDEESASIKKPASIVIKGDPMPGKDIALLKIDGGTNLPTLKIATDQLPRVGEQLYVYGYPGPVTNNDFVALESAIEPTLTTGIVSAIKKSIGGWPLIQMDANINHGSSGGPVCNEKGEVVGLTTFGSLENTGGLAAGLNFAIPVAILDEYLDTADIMPSFSKSSEIFAEGMNAFEKEYYRKALNKFEEVQRLNNYYPGLAFYISTCKSNIHRGEDKEITQVRNDLLGFSTVLLLVLLLYTMLRKKKIV
ncbi:MAG TPA: trypsin-like peptidase domain-containing protein [Puia sp.]|nr:trypsin-like peptidase domain-containing protein [Puia sp.]